MASLHIKPSRVIAVAVLVLAGLWIASGAFDGGPEPASAPEVAKPSVPLQKVGIEVARTENHSRSIVLSCVTEADKQALAVARVDGVVTGLNVTRGSRVTAGDVVAELSDEGRSAAVLEAKALLAQRQASYEANKKLIERGQAPKNDLPGLEAAVAAAEAALAAATAEADRRFIRAPVSGVVDSVPVQVGQAVQVGASIAKVVDPDPMLAVGSVSERQRGRLQPGQSAEVHLIDGTVKTGKIIFVSQAAEASTRTYRVEAQLDNPDGAIADGVTCEIDVTLEPIVATAVPRSALVFSDDGKLGVRAVDSGGRVAFHPVEVLEDNRQLVWVSGLESALRVITLGQDFVKEGDMVDAVSASELDARKEPAA